MPANNGRFRQKTIVRSAFLIGVSVCIGGFLLTASACNRQKKLPPSYDYRKEGRAPGVKNQQDLGTCWAFASLGALESSLLPQESWDFSCLLYTSQFAMIPMNFMKNKVADYIITGQWAKKAFAEAKLYGQANAVASSADKTFSYIPDCSDLPISENADYVYICENNTIYGTKFKTLPNTKGKPLVADVSSCFLSEPVEVEKYAMLYGGAQKLSLIHI